MTLHFLLGHIWRKQTVSQIYLLIDRVSGFIPVAPVQTERHKDFLAKELRVPTLIVYGELDKSLGPTSAANLGRAVAATKPFILKGARHPAYLDQPDKWHQLVINFVKIV